MNVFGSASYGHSTHCKSGKVAVEVMRCSLITDHDLIYRLLDNYYNECGYAFCGMKCF